MFYDKYGRNVDNEYDDYNYINCKRYNSNNIINPNKYSYFDDPTRNIRHMMNNLYPTGMLERQVDEQDILNREHQKYLNLLLNGSREELLDLQTNLEKTLRYLNAKIYILDQCSIAVEEISKDGLNLMFKGMSNCDLCQCAKVCKRWNLAIKERFQELFTFSEVFEKIRDKFFQNSPLVFGLRDIFDVQLKDSTYAFFLLMKNFPRQEFIENYLDLIHKELDSILKSSALLFKRKSGKEDFICDKYIEIEDLKVKFSLKALFNGIKESLFCSKLKAKLEISGGNIHKSVNEMSIKEIDFNQEDCPISRIYIYMDNDPVSQSPLIINIQETKNKRRKIKEL